MRSGTDKPDNLESLIISRLNRLTQAKERLERKPLESRPLPLASSKRSGAASEAEQQVEQATLLSRAKAVALNVGMLRNTRFLFRPGRRFLARSPACFLFSRLQSSGRVACNIVVGGEKVPWFNADCC